jgi:non-specific serine/threonine protein kinase
MLLAFVACRGGETPRQAAAKSLWEEERGVYAPDESLRRALSDLRADLARHLPDAIREELSEQAKFLYLPKTPLIRLAPDYWGGDAEDFLSSLRRAEGAKSPEERLERLTEAIETYELHRLRGPLLEGYPWRWIEAERNSLEERYRSAQENRDRIAARIKIAPSLSLPTASSDGSSRTPHESDSEDTCRASASASNLPPGQPASFVGRLKETAEVKRLLSETRLLTLTGAGGCGKTRLSLHVAADLANDYPDGARLVELAPLADPSLLPSQVAAALEIQADADRPALDALVEAIRSKELLLLLDNCEHLIEACAGLADRLLRTSPRLKILATSRERLGIAGETVYRVPSLSLPQEDGRPVSLEGSDAARLFLARAKAVSPEFALTPEAAEATARICRRLDGIPLAIELAAARMSVLTAERIAARLDNRFRLLTGGSRTAPPRHRTLSALIDWSHDLLEERERALLRRLSVFAGGWTLEAAEAVGAGEGIEREDTLDALSRLIDQSLVVAEAEEGGEVRYRMLETIRQYALERLREAGEAEGARERHMNHFLGFAEAAAEGCRGTEEPRWLERLEAEHDNLRAALDESSPGDERGLRLVAALGIFWRDKDHASEGVRRLDEALSRSAAPPRLRARLIEERMRFEWPNLSLGQVALLDEAAALYRSVGDIGGEARCLALSSRPRRWLGWDQANASAHEGIRLARLQSDRWTLTEVLTHSGMTFIYCGRGDEGLSALRESLEIARAIGNPLLIADRLDSLSWIYAYRNESSQRFACMEESLPYARSAGKGSFLLQLLGRLCREASAEKSPRIAVYLEEGLEAIRKLIDKRDAGWYLGEVVHAALRMNRIAETEASLIETVKMRRESGMVRPICLAHLGLARLARESGKSGEAAERLEEALRAAKERGSGEAFVALADVAEDTERAGRTDALFEACRSVLDGDVAFANVGKAETHTALFLRSLASLRDRARTADQHDLALALQAVRFEYYLRSRNANYASLHSNIADCVQELDTFAILASQAGEDVRAAILLGAAEALACENGIIAPHDSVEEMQDMERLTQARLSAEDFEAARSAGRAMSLDQAVAYALGEHLPVRDFP